MLALSAVANANDYGLLGDWPTTWKSGNGYEVSVLGLFQYDTNHFSGDTWNAATGTPLFENADDWRRTELDLSLKMPFGLELRAGYDWQNTWTDNYLKYSSDRLGSFRLGQFKTPVGWDGIESANAQTFLEPSLPGSAVFEGRRLGADWTFTGVDHWRFTAAALMGGNLDGEHKGDGLAGRMVFEPVNTPTRVLHLALAASRTWPDDHALSIGAKPEAALTPTRLVRTGTLIDTDAVDRAGLELGWMRGPFHMQAEYLAIRARRTTAQPDFTGRGFYVLGAWMLTGESRGYKDGNFTNTQPTRPWGALELAARYSELDLADGSIRGGRQHDWTIGANWYLGRHFKLQANYIQAHATDSPANQYLSPIDPRIFEMRAQIYF